jgi:hypothetical protein
LLDFAVDRLKPSFGLGSRLVAKERDLGLSHAMADFPALSRAGLAKRFVDLVGETPMRLLTGWRMHWPGGY